MSAKRISSLGLKPQPTCGAGATSTERGPTAPGTAAGVGSGAVPVAVAAAAAAGLLCELFRIGFAILEAVADEVAEPAGTAAPSRQVSIIVDDGRFGPGTGPGSGSGHTAGPLAADGAQVLVLAGVVLDPVPIVGEALAASPTAAEQPLSAVAPDFL